ncbi:MAG: DUF3783 domain-containing protein [Clostridia bacterium]|nr:DUF3783 domain-containing protein [Clostridia bacterium]
MKKVFLFNISGKKLERINMTAERLGIRSVSIDKKDFGLPLGEIVGRIGRFGEREQNADFTEEMLVMDGLDEKTLGDFLRGIRLAGAPVALKAVVTEHNLTLSPCALQKELAEEHAKVMAAINTNKKRPQ